MPMNWGAIQKIAGGIIERYGTSTTTTAVLRRGAVDRTVNIIILNTSAIERRGDLFQWEDKRVLIDPRNLDTPPDNEQDVLVIGGIVHKITRPPVQLAPDGATVLYWEVIVRTVTQ